MINQEHCRFRNTLEALKECREHMDDKTLSREEQKARTGLLQIVRQIEADYPDPDLDIPLYSARGK